MQSTLFCRNFLHNGNKKCCGILKNVILKKIEIFCETFKTKKLKRENMHVIENWV